MILQFLKSYHPIVYLLGSLILFSCSERSNATRDIPERENRTVNVVARIVETREFNNYFRLVGEVKAQRRVVVSLEVNGLIKSIDVKKGQSVNKGDVLAQIEDDLLRAAVAEAEAALNSSKLKLRNNTRLYEQNVIAESVFLESKYNNDFNEARYKQAKSYLKRAIIKAPISGVVDKLEMEAGELATVGRQIIELVNVDQVKVVAGVPERHLKYIQEGTQATVTLPGFPDIHLEKAINYIGTTLDPDSRTIPVEINLDNPGYYLKPEMGVTIRVVKEHIPQAIVIPQDAVIDTDQGRIVYVVEGHVARSIPITLGAIAGDQVLVTNGLAVGDSLIVVGHRSLVDGESIKVRNDRL